MFDRSSAVLPAGAAALLALTLALAGCSPRTAQPAPVPGDPYAEAAQQPPEPELLGAPEGPPPPEVAELAPPPDAPPPGAEGPVARYGGTEVIGQPALPRYGAEAPVRIPSIPSAPSPAPEESRRYTSADAAGSSVAVREPGVAPEAAPNPEAAQTERAEVIAPAPTPAPGGMAPIPNPPESGRTQLAQADPAPGLLGGPVAAPVDRPVPAYAPPSRTTIAPSTARTAAPTSAAAAPPARRLTRAEQRAAEKAADLTALRDALAADLKNGAVLSGVDALEPGTAGEVSLALPAKLPETLASKAEELGLAAAAEGATATATLTGGGYVIDPPGPQTVPLQAGQTPVFEWHVTPGRGDRGPLTADVSAEVGGPTDRNTLQIGELATERAEARGPGARLWWALGLIAVAIAAIAAFARRSSGPKPKARPATLDMNREPTAREPEPART